MGSAVHRTGVLQREFRLMAVNRAAMHEQPGRFVNHKKLGITINFCERVHNIKYRPINQSGSPPEAATILH